MITLAAFVLAAFALGAAVAIVGVLCGRSCCDQGDTETAASPAATVPNLQPADPPAGESWTIPTTHLPRPAPAMPQTNPTDARYR